MDEELLMTVGRKATTGMLTLVGRTAVLQAIAFIATFALTILLTPSVFGIFFIVSGIVAFLNYFSDIGLAAALIQKKEDLTTSDLRTTFTIQQALVLSIVTVSLFLAPWFSKAYGFDNDGLLLLQSLIVAFFLSSLKTIPSILLERELDFQKLVIPQIFETLCFYSFAVILAYLGWGIKSFSIAVVARGISGLVAIYCVRPWLPQIGIETKAAKQLLRFGIPFQINSFLALVKDDLFTVFLGKLLTFTDIGYIGWAKKWAEVPLRLLVDNIIRITFPAYARLQHNQEALNKAVEKALFFLALLVIPLVLEMIFLIRPLVEIIPRYGKWEPAVLSFYFFAASTIFSSISSPLVNALNAIGKIKSTLQLMILWTALTWTVIPFLILFWGFNGVAFGMFLISLTVIYVIKVARTYSPFSITNAFMKPSIAALVLFAFLLIGTFFLYHLSPYAKLAVLGVGGCFIYSLSAFILAKKEIISLSHKILHAQI